MSIDDYDQIIDLWRMAGLPFQESGRDSREGIERQLEMDSSMYILMELDGNIVASALVTHDGRKGWINRLAVHPCCRRRGLAKLLVEESERRLSELGINVFGVLIHDDNIESLRLFGQIGYREHDDIVYMSKRRRPED